MLMNGEDVDQRRRYFRTEKMLNKEGEVPTKTKLVINTFVDENRMNKKGDFCENIFFRKLCLRKQFTRNNLEKDLLLIWF